jgi:hypothetical protein
MGDVRHERDGVRETKWPRLRLVRQASGGEVARIPARHAARGRDEAGSNDGEVVQVEPASPSQLEVVWMIAPSSTSDKDARSVGILWRGERLVTDSGRSRSSRTTSSARRTCPRRRDAGSHRRLAVVQRPARVADDERARRLEALAANSRARPTSWDAWSKDRPDASMHPWNERQLGVPVAKQRPSLPRRARVELEIERPIDRIRRTRTLDAIDNQTVVLRVDDGRSVPLEPDAHVLIDAEWMKVVSVDGGRVVVERAQRGTTAVRHDKGARALRPAHGHRGHDRGVPRGLGSCDEAHARIAAPASRSWK